MKDINEGRVTEGQGRSWKVKKVTQIYDTEDDMEITMKRITKEDFEKKTDRIMTSRNRTELRVF